MCLVCKDEKVLWQEGPAGGLTVVPCPYCNKKNSAVQKELEREVKENGFR